MTELEKNEPKSDSDDRLIEAAKRDALDAGGSSAPDEEATETVQAPDKSGLAPRGSLGGSLEKHRGHPRHRAG